MAIPSRSGLRAVLGVIAAIVLLLLVGHVGRPGSERLTPPSSVASSLGRFGSPGPFADGVEFSQPISGLAVTREAVWVAFGTTIARLDPRTLRATATLQVNSVVAGIPVSVAQPIRGLSADGAAIWATVPSPGGGLLRIDAASARIVAVVPVMSIAPVAVSDSGLWAVCCGGEAYLGDAQLIRVDRETNRVAARISLPGLADAVGVGPSGVWVRAAAGPVWRVAPTGDRVVATVVVPGGLGGTQGSVLVGQDAVWMSDPASASVVRIDPRSNRVTDRVDVPGRALSSAADGTVLATGDQRVLGLGRGPVRSIRVEGLDGAHATALASGFHAIWVAESGVLLRVDQRGLR